MPAHGWGRYYLDRFVIMNAASDADHVFSHLNSDVRAEVRLPIRLADGTQAQALAYSFHGLVDGKEHIALGFGSKSGAKGDTPLVRVHSECLTGDVFGSLRCDCGPQLQESLRLLNQEGGYLLYLRQEGRGIGLYSKLDAYRLQEQGRDTYAANRELGHGPDERDYRVAAQMLGALGVRRVRLLTNNPDKRAQLEAAGIDVADTRPTGVFLNKHNLAYLQAKIQQTSHMIQLDQEPAEEALRAEREAI